MKEHEESNMNRFMRPYIQAGVALLGAAITTGAIDGACAGDAHHTNRGRTEPSAVALQFAGLSWRAGGRRRLATRQANSS